MNKVRFKQSYKGTFTYENDDVIVQVNDYRYEFMYEEDLEQLKACSYFKMVEKKM